MTKSLGELAREHLPEARKSLINLTSNLVPEVRFKASKALLEKFPHDGECVRAALEQLNTMAKLCIVPELRLKAAELLLDVMSRKTVVTPQNFPLTFDATKIEPNPTGEDYDSR